MSTEILELQHHLGNPEIKLTVRQGKMTIGGFKTITEYAKYLHQQFLFGHRILLCHQFVKSHNLEMLCIPIIN